MKNDLIPAVGYCRFSSELQREESIDAQIRAIRIFADQYGYDIKKFYIDRALSGKYFDRPEFLQLHKDCEKGEFQALIVHKLDRYSRSVEDTLSFEKILKHNDVELVSVCEQLDNSPQGQLVKTIIAACNQYQVANLATEVKKGMVENVHNGWSIGGHSPLGYDVVDKQYVINFHEAEAVKMIFEMYNEGNGYNTICQKLNNLGYRTKFSKPFGKSSLYSILRNEKYYGCFTYGKTYGRDGTGKRNMHRARKEDDVVRVMGKIPPIVDKALWDSVQERLNRNKNRGGSFTAKRNYLLSGLVYCECCGYAMSGHTRPSSDRKRTYSGYKCNHKANNFNCNCREIPKDVLEDFVKDQLEKFLFNDSIIPQLTKEVNAYLQQDEERDENEYKQMQRRVAKLVKAKSNVVDAIAQSGFSDALTDKLTELEREIAEAEKLVEDHTPKDMAKLMITEEKIKACIGEIKKDDEQTWKQLFETYVERVEVGNFKVKATFKLAVADEDEVLKLNITRETDRKVVSA